MSTPKAPKYLSPESVAIWDAVNKDFALSASDLSVLAQGLQHRDLADLALATLRKEGTLTPGTSKMNPAVVASKTHTQAWLSCVKTIGIHLDQSEED